MSDECNKSVGGVQWRVLECMRVSEKYIRASQEYNESVVGIRLECHRNMMKCRKDMTRVSKEYNESVRVVT